MTIVLTSAKIKIIMVLIVWFITLIIVAKERGTFAPLFSGFAMIGAILFTLGIIIGACL